MLRFPLAWPVTEAMITKLLAERVSSASTKRSRQGEGALTYRGQLRRDTKKLRQRRRRPSLSDLLVLALCLGGSSAAAVGRACSFETTLDQIGKGSHEVSVLVSHTFDGVPGADDSCPLGYGALEFELAVEEGDIRALFLDISINYGYLGTLDDNGPTLLYADNPTDIGPINLDNKRVDSVSGVAPPESSGGFDLGIPFGHGNCSSSVENTHKIALRIVGCAFTLAHIRNQRMVVITTGLGGDQESQVTASGLGRSVPSDCYLDDVKIRVLESRVATAETTTTALSPTSGSETSAVTFGSAEMDEGLTDCSCLQNVLKTDNKTTFISISEENPLTFTTSTDNCEPRTITVELQAWLGSSVKAAFFNLKNLDLDGFELTASVEYPADVSVSSEKVDQGQLSSIDGYSSNSSDFDMAIAFEGDSEFIEVELTGCGLTIYSFADNRAAIVVMEDDGQQYTLATPRLECLEEDLCTPAPTAILVPTHAPAAPNVSESDASLLPSAAPSAGLATPLLTMAPTALNTPAATLGPSAVNGSVITMAPTALNASVVTMTPTALNSSTATMVPSPSPTIAPSQLATTVTSSTREVAVPPTTFAPSPDPSMTNAINNTSMPSFIPRTIHTALPSSSVPPTPLPTTAPVLSGDMGGSVTGTLTVSGLNPDTEDEELYAATREGLGAVFDVNFTQESIAVSIDDSVNNSADVGSTVLADLTEEELAVLSPDPKVGDMFPGEIRRPPLEGRQRQKNERVEAVPRDGADRRYLVSANGYPNADAIADVSVGVDGTPRLRSQVSASGKGTMPVKGTSAGKDTRLGVRGGSSDLGLDDMNHLYKGRRALQTEGETTTAVVTMDFQVTLPKDDQQSASSRMASAVNELADSGITAVADALGVAPENVSMDDMSFCVGVLPCGNLTAIIMSDQTVSEELGTDSPWRTFLKYGGMLFLVIVGTCLFCFCSALICYHCLFDGGAYDELELFKSNFEVDTKGNGDELQRSSSNKVFQLPRATNRKPGSGSPEGTSSMLGADSVGKRSDGGDEDGNGHGDRILAIEDGERIESRADRKEGDRADSAGSRHWTSSQFGRKHSMDERYHANNPLRAPSSRDSSPTGGRIGTRPRRFSGSSGRGNRYRDDYTLESVEFAGAYDEPEGEFKTTNPMFIGRDTGSRTPSPGAPSSTFLGALHRHSGDSSNRSFSAGSSSSSVAAAAAAGAGGAVRRGAFRNCGVGGGHRNHIEGNSLSSDSPLAVLSERGSSESTEATTDDAATAAAVAAHNAAKAARAGQAPLGSSIAEGVVSAGLDEGVGARARVNTTPASGLAVGDSVRHRWGPSDVYSDLRSASPSISPGVIPEDDDDEGSDDSNDRDGGDGAAERTHSESASKASGGEADSPSTTAVAEAVHAWGTRATQRGLPEDVHVVRDGQSSQGEAEVEMVVAREREQERSANLNAERRSRGTNNGSGLSVLWHGLIGGRDRGTMRHNRFASHQGVNTSHRFASSESTDTGLGTRHRQHPSATARWATAPSSMSSGPGTGSMSSASSSTARISADQLSHPTTGSTESDFSLSEVFAGAVSPAGLAAAAAASSAVELFPAGLRRASSGASASSSDAATPQGHARPRPIEPFNFEPFEGGSTVVRPIAATGASRLVAAVAEAAAETAAEEDAKREGKRKAEEQGAARERNRRAGVIPAAPVDTVREEPLPMHGASLPARLAVPQAMLSPTSPTGDASRRVSPSATVELELGQRLTFGDGSSRIGTDVLERGGSERIDRATPELSPGAVMLSPGTDSDRGSSPSPENVPGVNRGNGGNRGGERGMSTAQERHRGSLPEKTLGDRERSLPAWIVTRKESASAGLKEGVVGSGGGSFVVGGGSEGVRDSEEEEATQTEARTVSISPQSATSAGSSMWRGLGLRGPGSYPGARHEQGRRQWEWGTDEAPTGRLAERAGKMRALGTLDMTQVMGNFSDSESPDESRDVRELSPRGRRSMSPRVQALITEGRPTSPIHVVPTSTDAQMRSPLPNIQAVRGSSYPLRGVSVGVTGRASVVPGGTGGMSAGGSPGVESIREYSESDEDDLDSDTPGSGGILKGERLIP